jgi:hypothetical protein
MQKDGSPKVIHGYKQQTKISGNNSLQTNPECHKMIS